MIFWSGVTLCYLAVPAPSVTTALFWGDPYPWAFVLAVVAPAVLLTAGLGLMRFDAWLDEV